MFPILFFVRTILNAVRSAIITRFEIQMGGIRGMKNTVGESRINENPLAGIAGLPS